MSLLSARKDAKSSSGGFSVGVYYLELGLRGGRESEFLRNVTHHKSTVSDR